MTPRIVITGCFFSVNIQKAMFVAQEIIQIIVFLHQKYEPYAKNTIPM